MSALTTDDLRHLIENEPERILGDADIMRALAAANERSMGGNVVDIRGIAMERLEARLDRLEDTHRAVIAAAYDNISGTHQIHRAVLAVMDADSFEQLVTLLGDDLARILKVDALRLVLESQDGQPDSVTPHQSVLAIVPPGFVGDYLTRGRPAQDRPVLLRQVAQGGPALFGDSSEFIRSEACLRLDLGPRRRPAMLVMGAEDPHQFSPQQGTDLLSFFAAVAERELRRWLG